MFNVYWHVISESYRTYHIALAHNDDSKLTTNDIYYNNRELGWTLHVHSIIYIYIREHTHIYII